MTTAQRNLRYNAANLNLPDIGKFLNSILDALREHGGKASRDDVTNEAEYLLRNRYNLLASTPTLDIAIKNRLERALELLSKTGLVCKKGLYSLSLTSRALIVSKEELESIALDIPIKAKIERQVVLPLPDEIAMRVINELKTAQLTALEVEELVLRHYAQTNALLTVDQTTLDELRRRTITARRVLESRNLIHHDQHELFTLTARGRAVSQKQVQRITCLSFGSFFSHQLLKLRLTMETRAQNEVRQSILRSFAEFIAGLFHHVVVQKPNQYQQSHLAGVQLTRTNCTKRRNS